MSLEDTLARIHATLDAQTGVLANTRETMLEIRAEAQLGVRELQLRVEPLELAARDREIATREARRSAVVAVIAGSFSVLSALVMVWGG